MVKSPIHDLVEEHYRANYDILCRHVSYRVGGMLNAEDIVQEAYLKALRLGYLYDPERAIFDTWFGTVLNSSLKDHMRSENNYGMSFEQEDFEEPEVKLSGYEQRLLEELAQHMTSRDSHQHSSILYLHFMREFKVNEIAKTMDIGLAQVKKVILRYKQEVVHKYGRLHANSS